MQTMKDETLQIDGINKMEWHLSDDWLTSTICIHVTHSCNMHQLFGDRVTYGWMPGWLGVGG